jgi:hypothetical protein
MDPFSRLEAILERKIENTSYNISPNVDDA